jgi:cysteine-rich repeat protein
MRRSLALALAALAAVALIALRSSPLPRQLHSDDLVHPTGEHCFDVWSNTWCSTQKAAGKCVENSVLTKCLGTCGACCIDEATNCESVHSTGQCYAKSSECMKTCGVCDTELKPDCTFEEDRLADWDEGICFYGKDYSPTGKSFVKLAKFNDKLWTGPRRASEGTVFAHFDSELSSEGDCVYFTTPWGTAAEGTAVVFDYNLYGRDYPTSMGTMKVDLLFDRTTVGYQEVWTTGATSAECKDGYTTAVVSVADLVDDPDLPVKLRFHVRMGHDKLSDMGLDNVRVVTKVCGDGKRVYEGCDDGNKQAGDGCSASCTIEDGYRCYPHPDNPDKDKCERLKCGDGVVSTGEGCDDGNDKNGDGCSKTCTVEEGFFCVTEPVKCLDPCLPEIGQDVLYPGPSACVPVYDQSPFIYPTGCTSANPTSEFWDMLPEATKIATSGCGAYSGSLTHAEPWVKGLLFVYQTTATGIGNTAKAVCPSSTHNDKLAQVACYEMGFAIGTVTGSQTWEDKGCDTAGRDSWGEGWVCGADDTKVGGCSNCPATCTSAIEVTCDYSGVCGDGFRRHSTIELCDDGNTEDGDGCSSSCTVETDWICEGGSWLTADTCFKPECGNFMREGPEGCDDGNLEAGDGCSPTCTMEDGYWCDVSPPEKPDPCYMKGDIRLQKYTVTSSTEEKWPLVATGKLQVMGVGGWGSVCAQGFDQKDGNKACEAVGQKMEGIPFYLQPPFPASVAVPKYDMRAGDPACPCLSEETLKPILEPFKHPENKKAKDCPFLFGATSRDECVPWQLSEVEGAPDPTVDPIYGSYCAAWDTVATGSCYDPKKKELKNDAPDWCEDSWCYVDPLNCGGAAALGVTPTMFFPEVDNLYYNYLTCVDPVPAIMFEGGCCKKGNPTEGLFYECGELLDSKCDTCDEAVVLTCGSHP